MELTSFALFVFACATLVAQEVAPVCPGLTPGIPVGAEIGDVQDMAVLQAVSQPSNVASWITLDNVLASKWPAVSSGETVAIFGSGLVPSDGDLVNNYPNLVEVLVNGSAVSKSQLIYAGHRLDGLLVIENSEIVVTLPVLTGPTASIQVKQTPTAGSGCFGPPSTLRVVQTSVVDDNGQFVSPIRRAGDELSLQIVGMSSSPASLTAAIDGNAIEVISGFTSGAPGVYKIAWRVPVGLRPGSSHTFAYIGSGVAGTWVFSVLAEQH